MKLYDSVDVLLRVREVYLVSWQVAQKYSRATLRKAVSGHCDHLAIRCASGGNQLLSSAALLIVGGVVLDTIRQLDAQLVMHNTISW